MRLRIFAALLFASFAAAARSIHAARYQIEVAADPWTSLARMALGDVQPDYPAVTGPMRAVLAATGDAALAWHLQRDGEGPKFPVLDLLWTTDRVTPRAPTSPLAQRPMPGTNRTSSPRSRTPRAWHQVYKSRPRCCSSASPSATRSAACRR